VTLNADTGKGATPFRVTFKGYTLQSSDELIANIQANENVPALESVPFHNRKLAIVGGGPSILNNIKRLQQWDGEIWAINKTPDWCAENGIKSVLVSVDAALDGWPDPANVTGAIFSSWCAPSVVSRYPNVRVFPMRPYVDHGIPGGSSTASSMPVVAALMGYTDITYFGCEGSFIDADHAYCDEKKPHQLIVKANGIDFRTNPAMYVQCQELSEMIKSFNGMLREESGGLLRAMCVDEQWEVVAVSEALKQLLEETNGANGCFDKEYRWVI